MADSKDTPVYCTCAMSQRCTALYRGLPTAKTKAKINQNTLFSSIVKHSIACKSDTISQELFCGACCDKMGLDVVTVWLIPLIWRMTTDHTGSKNEVTS